MAGRNLLLLACCARIITRELRVSATPVGALLAITAALWSCPLWTLSLTGQLSGVLALATTLAWRQLRARRPTKVAWCLGLAASHRCGSSGGRGDAVEDVTAALGVK